jgi:Ca-activated chloride channel family protein
MDYILQFANAHVLYILIPFLIVVLIIRMQWYKKTRFTYPLTSVLASSGFATTHPHTKIIGILRFVTLALLLILIAQPQYVDPKSNIHIEGIDIVLVMDVSGSMDLPHHSDDDRSRLQVAKKEAMHFIDKRSNDAIGLVIFGKDALSRCPLTADRYILKHLIHDLEMGVVDPDGTVLSTAILTAANRLKRSQAKSKIMIVLTDGEPSEHDSDPRQAIEIAKKLGIKIYTIGIGDNQEVLMRHPMYGIIPMKTTLNKPLLTLIARETDGRFFEAKNAHDMRQIYDTIDTLEKTELTTPIFSSVYDWFMPLLWAAFILLIIEIVLTSFIWFCV